MPGAEDLDALDYGDFGGAAEQSNFRDSDVISKAACERMWLSGGEWGYQGDEC